MGAKPERDLPLYGMKGVHIVMCLVAKLLVTAEKELGAFCAAASRMYGPEESERAAAMWIEILETFDWPTNEALPNWRWVTILAADRLASLTLQCD